MMIFGYSPLDYEKVKIVLMDASGLSKDALHVYVGLALFLLVRLIWRRRGGWVLAWLVVLAAALAAEWIDIEVEKLDNGNQPMSAHWHDIWNTMFWPTVLLLVGPWLQPRPKPDVPSGDLADQTLEEPPPI